MLIRVYTMNRYKNSFYLANTTYTAMKNFLIKTTFLTSFLIGAAQLSAQTISYDSIQTDGSRNDTLTLVEDFADTQSMH